MIIGVIFFSLVCLWLGGALFTLGVLGAPWAMAGAYVLTALGAGWLGIIYSAQFRLIQSSSIRKSTDGDTHAADS